MLIMFPPSSRNLSTDTLHTRRSHRSVSKDRAKGGDKRRDRPDTDEKRKRSRSRDRSERGYRDRSRDRHRDRDRDRDRDKDRRRDRDGERHRSSRHDDSRHSHRERDRDRDDKDRDRRRKRDEFEGSERDHDDRVKRKRSEIAEDILPPPPPPSTTLPPPPPRDSPLSVRSTDRKKGDRHTSRDDFDEPRARRSQSRNLMDDEEPLTRHSPPLPGVRYVRVIFPALTHISDMYQAYFSVVSFVRKSNGRTLQPR